MSKEPDRRQLIEYEKLNSAGKAVFIAGSVYKMAERVVDFTFTTLSYVWDEAEKAFAEGLSDSSTDVIILEDLPPESTTENQKGKRPTR